MSAYAQPTHLIFGTIKGTEHLFRRTKNGVHRYCVGGNMVILIFGSFKKHGGFCKNSFSYSYNGTNEYLVMNGLRNS